MNRRFYLKNRRRFIAFLMILTIALSLTIFAASVDGAGNEENPRTVLVEKGDTLWALAKKHCKKGDIRIFIHEMERLNNITDSTIYAGDILKLPLQ